MEVQDDFVLKKEEDQIKLKEDEEQKEVIEV